jgi:hypothetical protein
VSAAHLRGLGAPRAAQMHQWMTDASFANLSLKGRTAEGDKPRPGVVDVTRSEGQTIHPAGRAGWGTHPSQRRFGWGNEPACLGVRRSQSRGPRARTSAATRLSGPRVWVWEDTNHRGPLNARFSGDQLRGSNSVRPQPTPPRIVRPSRFVTSARSRPALHRRVVSRIGVRGAGRAKSEQLPRSVPRGSRARHNRRYLPSKPREVRVGKLGFLVPLGVRITAPERALWLHVEASCAAQSSD